MFSSAREGTPSGVIGRPFCIGVGSNPLTEGGRGEGALEEVADCSAAVAELRGIGVGNSSTKLADVECMVAGTSCGEERIFFAGGSALAGSGVPFADSPLVCKNTRR